MEDQEIIDLYWNRSEQAIEATAEKYGKLCYRISYNILENQEDSEESVSDTYLAVWNKIPPTRPHVFSAFLAKITRYISINRWKAQRTHKRGGGQIVLALDELKECGGQQSIEASYEGKELIASYNRFLEELPRLEREIFLRRYFFLDSIKAISKKSGFSESKVTSMLYRIREKFREHLEREEYL